MHRQFLAAAGLAIATLAFPAHAQKSIDFIEHSKAWGVVVADFNHDGHDDLFITGHDSDDRIWFWTPTGYVPSGQPLPWKDRHACAAADVNGDGRLDLYCAIGAVSGTGIKSNELWIQQPNRVFVEAASFGAEDPTGRGRRPVFLDLDHDGRPDLYIANEATARADHLPNFNHLYLNTGNGAKFIETTTIATGDRGFGCVVEGDIDGDGWDDLLVCNTRGASHLYVNNHRNDFTELATPAYGTGWKDAKLVDMNGDGKADLVVVTADNHLQIWLNTGLSPYYVGAPSFDGGLPARGTSVAVGDFDGDGHMDAYVVLADSNCAAAGPDLAGDAMYWGRGGSWTKAQFVQSFGGCGHVAATVDGNRVLLANGTPSLRGPNYVLGFGH